MEDKSNSELDALINACLDDCLSEAEAERLSRWIEESNEARERYWQLASVHGMVEQSMQSASLKAATGEEFVTPVQAEGLSLRPRFSGIAAGIVIGIFSASLVWAYGIPLVTQPQRESKEIVNESFEDPEMELLRRFPTNANQWFGRVSSVPGDDGMPAVSGTRVGQFNTWPKTKLTYAWYLIDLDEHPQPGEEHVRTVEVEASFFTSNPAESSVFQIRLGAFSQEPVAIRPIWNDHETLFDTVLQHVGRNHITKPGDQTGWHKLRATIEIPRGTRSVVVSLGAGNDDPDAVTSEHYVDAVQVHLVDTVEPLD
ncbi:MAG: hypothetical protein CML07_04410 [Psychrobacter sp.]|nr:hypothetical protein [Psychrobacter sp.]